MSPQFFVGQLIAGISNGMLLFLVASGLALIFGVSRIINFAHGSLFMVGAYVSYIVSTRIDNVVGFWMGLACGTLVSMVIGVVVEIILLRHFYHRPELYQLLVTFALTLIIADLTTLVFGSDNLVAPSPAGLEGALTFGRIVVPQYSIVLVLIGAVVGAALWVWLRCSASGLLIRAVAEDALAAATLGTDGRRMRTVAFAVGAALAGFAGGLQNPVRPLTPTLDGAIITEAFAVVVIGGMGSIPGALLASLFVSVALSFGAVLFPRASVAIPFIVMASILVIRRRGLSAEQDVNPVGAPTWGARVRTLPAWAWIAVASACVLAATAGSRTVTAMVAELAIFALFASSAQLLVANGGMITFGHAVPFGVGAYVCALAITQLQWPFVTAAATAVIAGALCGVIAGWVFAASRSIYFAMLTLASCEILRSFAQQSETTGGDNGVLGVRTAWFEGAPVRWTLFVVAIVSVALVILRRADVSVFGLLLRASRDNALRAASSGVRLQSVRTDALTLASAAAGLAGALFALHRGSVFLDSLSTEMSMQPLLMSLVGGLFAFEGPAIGAIVLRLTESVATSYTTHWQMCVGGLIIATLLIRPAGIVERTPRR